MLPDDVPDRVRRWFYVWIATGVVILLAVAGLLVPVFLSVESIPDNLRPAREEVTGIGDDVQPLPEYVQEINEALATVERAVEPLPRLTRLTVQNLRSIRTTLTSVESTLNQTSELLVDTDAVLEATASTLVVTRERLSRTLDIARDIDQELESVQAADSQGTALIPRRVAAVNSSLAAVENDATSIARGLDEIDFHLEAACQALPLGALPGQGTGPGGGTGPGEPPPQASELERLLRQLFDALEREPVPEEIARLVREIEQLLLPPEQPPEQPPGQQPVDPQPPERQPEPRPPC